MLRYPKTAKFILETMEDSRIKNGRHAVGDVVTSDAQNYDIFKHIDKNTDIGEIDFLIHTHLLPYLASLCDITRSAKTTSIVIAENGRFVRSVGDEILGLISINAHDASKYLEFVFDDMVKLVSTGDDLSSDCGALKSPQTGKLILKPKIPSKNVLLFRK